MLRGALVFGFGALAGLAAGLASGVMIGFVVADNVNKVAIGPFPPDDIGMAPVQMQASAE